MTYGDELRAWENAMRARGHEPKMAEDGRRNIRLRRGLPQRPGLRSLRVIHLRALQFGNGHT